MEEDIAIINNNTRNERIKNFFVQNKKILISAFLFLLIVLVSFFAFSEYRSHKKIEISDLYNSAIIEYSDANKKNTTDTLVNLVNKKDSTYSPLSLYFIIDNSLIYEKQRVNELFDIVIEETPLEIEIKNLIIYKKALYNADFADENQLLKILNPIINSKSVWKAQAIYLMAEYFYSNNEKQKAKEFYNTLIGLENIDQDLQIEAQKRLNRDLSE